VKKYAALVSAGIAFVIWSDFTRDWREWLQIAGGAMVIVTTLIAIDQVVRRLK
jgi:cytochrome c biogenesis protein CcdA